MYSLIYSQSAFKQLKNLNKETQKRIISTLERCRIRPYPHVKKLIGNPYFSLRVGDYRVILDINQNKLIILVVKIGHRKDIYKDKK